MEIDNFLNNVATGNAVEAQSNIHDLLSSKAFEALDGYKQEIAKAMFSPNTEITQELPDENSN